ncbi:hypothetical protein EJ110_NYTH49431 [Nymphaea thermarum]|nr:hypothetical protein EJ110_NYTH49431 [Nymphaea thermarum]
MRNVKFYNIKKAFGRFQELDCHYPLTPTKDKWKKATIIHNSLKIFYEATNVIFSAKYPTSNIFFKEFCEIMMEIEKMCLTYEDVSTIKNYICDIYHEYNATYALKTLSIDASYIVDVKKDNDASNFTFLIDFSFNKKPRTNALDDFLK